MSKFLDQTGLARVRDWIKTNFATKTAFGGASANQNGSSGLVPAPTAGDQDKVLGADGTWKTVSGGGESYSDFTGAEESVDGEHGLVPAPLSGQQSNVLFGGGFWALIKPIISYQEVNGSIYRKIGIGYKTAENSYVLSPSSMASSDVIRKKLWENASPTSNFASQSITLPDLVTNYHFLLFEFVLSKDSDFLDSVLLPTSYGMYVGLRTSNAANGRAGVRTITIITSGSSIASVDSASYNGNTNNGYVIPIRITGIKL